MKLRDVIFASLLVPATALAQPAPSQPVDDGYCDFVQGTADATAATLLAPQVFGQFGYIEQPAFNPTPADDPSNLRLLAGVRYSLSNVYQGMVTKSRARAECKRHNAIVALRGVTAGRAVAARIKAYEEHMAEATQILQKVGADLEARRATLQEANATRMRVDGLRSQLSAAKAELASLPQQDSRPLASLLSEFRTADADVERNEGKLRSAQAYDVSLRFGVDRFLEGSNSETRYFGVVQLGINLGALWTGSGNSRAARGRAKYARSGNDPLVASTNATVDQLRSLIAVEQERAQQTRALVADLGHQMEILDRMGTEDARRLRETLWFDWVKAKADWAYLNAHVTAMQEIVGAHAQAQ